MSDGRLWFNTKIDNTGIEKDLRDLERKIKKSQETISKAENAKLPLENQLKSINEELEKGKQKLESYKKRLNGLHLIAFNPKTEEDKQAAKAEIPIYHEKVAAQEEEIKRLQKEWEDANKKVKDYDREIEQANEDISRHKEKAEELAKVLKSPSAKLQAAYDKAHKSADRFGKRLLEIAKSALIFNLISSALRLVVNYFGKVLKTNSEYTAQLAKLKGALLTAFQPIYEFILPGLLAVLRVLTSIVQVAANVLSVLFGKSASDRAKNAKALYDEAEAIDAVGGAAKDAQKSLAGFDEINTLGSAGGESGGSGSSIAPDFSSLQLSDIEGPLQRIMELVGMIGAGLLAWKIAAPLAGALSVIAGIILTIIGALLLGTSIADAFTNGIDWENLSGMLLGLALVVGGLALAFGATAAAIGLLIGGIALVMVSFNEWMITGALSTEACIALTAGILAIGGAIALLTGSWIPLVIAAIAAFVIAAVTKGDEIKAGLQKLDDWLQGVFEKDWTELFGPVLGSVLNGFFSVVKGIWGGVKKILEGLIDFVGGVFSGDWQKAWDGIKRIFKGCFESFSGIFQPIIDALAKAWSGLGDLLPDTWKEAINAIVAVVNKFIGWLNKTLTFKIPPIKIAGASIFDGGTIRLVNLPSIPYLAQGAVIPPNAPFMAMLGDQKNGTNIEAPLSTIQEALANVLAAHGTGDIRITFAGDLAQLGRVLKPVVERENNRVGGSLAKG